jgi:hypothetical protein
VPWLLALSSGLARSLGNLRLGTSRPWRRLHPVSGHAAGGAAPRSAAGPGEGEVAQVLPVDWVTGAALAIRRATWEVAGPLDERFAVYCQDLDLCLAAGDRGWRVGVARHAIVMHHHGATLADVTGVGAARYNPPALWADLVRLAAKRQARAGARRTGLALRLGGWLRRQLLLPAALAGANRGRSARRERTALLAAAAAAREAARASAAAAPRGSLPGA